ncbi:hypothetical protein, partial [Candidatus Avelusimicrobium faecicola]|uniref:hypothetical protein n=1 Tax=Candidatus Avelusimicrobium faecicola TaxID=3416205 RepID=UPI003D0C03C6
VRFLLGAPFTDDSVGTIVGTFKKPQPQAGVFYYLFSTYGLELSAQFKLLLLAFVPALHRA